MNVVIVDTGCANLASVGFALDRIGAKKTITKDPKKIKKAKRVILPGVGAAPFAMQNLRERELVETLQNLTQPILGICLGMQLLFNFTEEGEVPALGMVHGRVLDLDTGNQPSPHMGWNTLENVADDPLLKGVNSGDYAYFVHSYAVPIGDYTLASATHGDTFSAIIRQDNIFGCQFHPERSGATGARILENFLKASL